MKQLFNRTNKKITSFFKKSTLITVAIGLLLSLTLSIILKATASAASLTPQAKVSFTFDDGLSSAATYADPILKAAGFTGTDYVISGCVGMTTVPNTCHANQNTPYLTWAQVNQLKADGWEIGDHTVDHPCLASNATADPSDCPTASLTPTQVKDELVNSKAAIAAQTGVTPTDFASPYGDWTPPVLANIAENVASHRGFADSIDQNGDGIIDHGNTFPYNDYLLYDFQVQGDGTIAGGVTVAQVQSMIDQSKANNQWLVLTFHNILPTASPDPTNYEYSTSNFQQIVDYVKASSLPVVNINNGIVTNNGNLLPNASFNTPLSSNTADTTVWSTDSPTVIKQDTGSNGNYPDPINSVLLGSSTNDVSLFSPEAPIDGTKTYVLKNYLNITSMSVAAGHEFEFYMDEYDANGNALPTRLMRTEVGNTGSTVGAWVESLNFEYKPSGTNVAKARMRVVVTANSATTAYLDNVQWFAEDGSTTGVTPPPPGQGGTYNNQILTRPDGRAYYVSGGQAHPIGNPAIRDCIEVRHGTGQWLPVADAVIDSQFTMSTQSYCNYEQESGLNFVREAGDPTVWLVHSDGTKQHVGGLCVVDAYTTVLKKFHVYVVPQGETAGHIQTTDYFGDPQICAQLPG